MLCPISQQYVHPPSAARVLSPSPTSLSPLSSSSSSFLLLSSPRQHLPPFTSSFPQSLSMVPWDQRVKVYWNAPADTGGLPILEYKIEKVTDTVSPPSPSSHISLPLFPPSLLPLPPPSLPSPPSPPPPPRPRPLRRRPLLVFTPLQAPFIEGNSEWDNNPFFSQGSSTSVCVTGLTNFIPWYFRVTARNKLGYGLSSSLTRDSMPWVAPSDPPTSLAAHAGNRQVWLSWAAPNFDGGRPIVSYVVEIAHESSSFLLCGDPHGCSSSPVPWARKDPRPVDASFTWQQVPVTGLVYGAVPADKTYPISSSSPQQDSLLAKTRATDLPDCHLPPPPVVLTSFLVKLDAQGHLLMNNYKYHLRVRAYNNYQLSAPSGNVTLFLIGRIPYPVQGLNATCYESREGTDCTAGFSGDTRIPIAWKPPSDDGGMDVTGYLVEYSIDGGATWTEHVPQSKQDPRTLSYILTCMQNDKPHLLRVRAINLYGQGDAAIIGPVTPRWCPHMQPCGVCVQPNYELWGGCNLPNCSRAGSRPDTRFINCTGGGCR
eukprot:123258-Hanusia_phi.AAC.4